MSNSENEMKQLKKARKHADRTFQGWFAAFALILFGFELFLLGYNIGKSNTQDALTDLILAVFWLGLFFIQTRSWKLDLEMKYLGREVEHLERVGKVFEELAEHEAERRAKHNAELLVAILKDMFGKGKKRPTQKDIPRIEAAFHDQADDYVKLTMDSDNGFNAEFSNKPFVPGRSDAHEAARLRGDAGRGNSAKPISKSQERREKALRDEKNAKRRAARAAKKAEGGQ